MNTKPIPIIITLLAAGISCLVSAIQGVSFGIYTKRLIITVVCFAVIGIVVRVVLDRSFAVMEPKSEDEEQEVEEDESTLEDVHSGEEQEE